MFHFISGLFIKKLNIFIIWFIFMESEACILSHLKAFGSTAMKNVFK